MDTKYNVLSPDPSGKLSNSPSSQAEKMIRLGRRNGWGFHVLGYAEMPEKPVHLEKWLIIPAHQDTSPIPFRTMQRIQTIYSAGLRPQGFVVVHEAPRNLPAPIKTQSFFNLPAPENAKVVQSTASGTSDFLAELDTVVSTLAKLFFPLLFLGVAVVLDPIVIAIMEDGCWVEIDRWNV